MHERLVPITDSGFNQHLGHLIEIFKRHIAIDPHGENTRVQRIAGAKVNKRSCQVIRITHSKKQNGLEFHLANLFLDEQLRVPLRFDSSDWPTQPNQEPPLIAEHTYTDLKLNVGLTDRAFAPRLLRGNR